VNLLPTISSEWLKFRSVRSTLYTLAVTVFLCVGIGALVCFAERQQWPHETLPEHVAFDPVRTSLFGFFFAEIAIGVIGVLIMSSEYSSGSIRMTLAATPRRLSVLISKAVVLFASTLVVGEACAFVSFLIGQIVLRPEAPTATLSSPGALRAVFLGGMSLALLSLLALGIATMLRHTAGAITVYVSLQLVLLLIVSALPTSWNVHILKFLPEVLTQSMRAAHANGVQFTSFSPWISTLVLASYAVASLIGAGWFLLRRDA
jgi:ABC-2 type transport system permease protein